MTAKANRARSIISPTEIFLLWSGEEEVEGGRGEQWTLRFVQRASAKDKHACTLAAKPTYISHITAEHGPLRRISEQRQKADP